MKNYRELVLGTLNKKLNQKELLTNVAMGMSGEAGEFTDMIKKHVFHEHELDKAELIKELGDVRWYLEVAAYAIGTTIEEIEQKNVEKLAKRYPNGFSFEDSKNRTE